MGEDQTTIGVDRINIALILGIVAVATIGGFLFGYDSGAVNGTQEGLQTTFGLESMPKSLLLHLYHDEDIELYLNGQPVLQRENYNSSYEKIQAPAAFMAALQTGRNVLSAHLRQKSGGQFFDLGIEIDAVMPADIVLDESYRSVSRADRGTYRRNVKRLVDIADLRKSPGFEAMVVTEAGPVPPPGGQAQR